jgi:hypothetical protein
MSDAASWTGTGVAIAVALVSVWKAHRAEQTSAEAVAESHRQSDAQDRMAVALEQRLSSSSSDADSEAVMKWVIEPTVPDGYWLLRNEGTATAYGVEIVVPPKGLVIRDLPCGDTDLAPFQSARFSLQAAGWGAHLPGELLVRTRGQSEPATVRLPPTS